MNLLQHFYPESQLSGFSHVDGTIAFYSQIQATLDPGFTVLDIGCGRGKEADDQVAFRRNLTCFKAKCAKVIGIDVDPIGSTNPLIDEFRKITSTDRWPVEDGSVDLCLADTVLEHVDNIDSFFRECNRVLRPGGRLCIRTPNALGYVGLLSSLIPNSIHVRVLKRAQPGRKEGDIFPTLYRCNTLWKLRRTLRKHGFEPCVYGYEAEPSYLGFSRLAYRFGVMHQRLAPSFLKLTIFAFGIKTN